MKINQPSLIAILLASSAFCSNLVHAQAGKPNKSSVVATLGHPADIAPVEMPGDSRVVRFVYARERIYRLLAAPLKVTTLVLDDGESLKQEPTSGDTIRWEIQHEDNLVYIKPSQGEISTTLSLVTNRRIYNFTLVASPNGGMFYQSVSFNYPDRKRKPLTAKRTEAELGDEIEEEPPKRAAASTGIDQRIDLSKINRKYLEPKGEADFKPTERVFDDGRYTYVAIPNGATWPNAYMREDGNDYIVETHKSANFLVIHKVMKEFRLRWGTKEIVITAGEEPKRWWQSSKAE
jgi:type IV secretion system protein TrbG